MMLTTVSADTHRAAVATLCAAWALAGLTAALEYVVCPESPAPAVCVRFANTRDAAHGAQIARASKRAGAAVDAANNNGDGTVTVYLAPVAS